MATTPFKLRTSTGWQGEETKALIPQKFQYGVALSPSLISTPAVRNDLVSLGVHGIRTDIFWADIETAQGTYNWSAIDTVVNGCEASGLKVLAVVHTEPQWSSGQSVWTYAPVTAARRTNYAKFCAAAVRRYGKRIAVWEIWNEPNLSMFWKPTPSTSDYLLLLREAVSAMRAVDPSTVIISGGMGGAGAAPDIGHQPWTTAMIQGGADLICDGIATHHYSNTPGDMWAVQLVRTALDAVGRDTQIWLTEFGCPTGTPGVDWPGTAFGCTPAVQKQIIEQGVTVWKSLSPKGGAIIFYTYQDLTAAQQPDQREQHFGFKNVDGSPKPGYEGIRKASLEASIHPIRTTQIGV